MLVYVQCNYNLLSRHYLSNLPLKQFTTHAVITFLDKLFYSFTIRFPKIRVNTGKTAKDAEKQHKASNDGKRHLTHWRTMDHQRHTTASTILGGSKSGPFFSNNCKMQVESRFKD